MPRVWGKHFGFVLYLLCLLPPLIFPEDWKVSTDEVAVRDIQGSSQKNEPLPPLAHKTSHFSRQPVFTGM